MYSICVYGRFFFLLTGVGVGNRVRFVRNWSWCLYFTAKVATGINKLHGKHSAFILFFLCF